MKAMKSRSPLAASFSATASLIMFLLNSSICYADAPPSYAQIHPILWMHQLPTGEQPGWSTKNWFNYEVNEGNVWGVPMTMTDNRNGNVYNYESRFEQTTVNLEFGHAFSDQLAGSIVIPYANRWGGFMDHVINAYHETIWGQSLFERNLYPQYQNVYSVKTNGHDFFSSSPGLNEVSNFDLKLKWWVWQGPKDKSQPLSPTQKESAYVKNGCACGFAVSSFTKIPLGTSGNGGTTGYIDQSIGLHYGRPILKRSSAWVTLSYTWLGPNPAIESWPRNDHILMYEFNFDFNINDKWGFITNFRVQSPILKMEELTYFNTASDTQSNQANLDSSAWNSLVHSVGSESVGLRYQRSANEDLRFLFVEDWGFGPYSHTGSVYTNNAPDVALVIQGRTIF